MLPDSQLQLRRWISQELGHNHVHAGTVLVEAPVLGTMRSKDGQEVHRFALCEEEGEAQASCHDHRQCCCDRTVWRSRHACIVQAWSFNCWDLHFWSYSERCETAFIAFAARMTRRKGDFLSASLRCLIWHSKWEALPPLRQSQYLPLKCDPRFSLQSLSSKKQKCQWSNRENQIVSYPVLPDFLATEELTVGNQQVNAEVLTSSMRSG